MSGSIGHCPPILPCSSVPEIWKVGSVFLALIVCVAEVVFVLLVGLFFVCLFVLQEGGKEMGLGEVK